VRVFSPCYIHRSNVSVPAGLGRYSILEEGVGQKPLGGGRRCYYYTKHMKWRKGSAHAGRRGKMVLLIYLYIYITEEGIEREPVGRGRRCIVIYIQIMEEGTRREPIGGEDGGSHTSVVICILI